MNSNSATTCRLPSWVVSLLVLMLLAGAAAAETVNINKASAEAMQEHLTGIGPAKSQAIVDYRKKHGSFKSTDDLLQVPGIGTASLEKIRGNVSINRGVTDASKGFKPRARSGTAAGSVTDRGGRKASDAAQGRKTGTAKSGTGAGDGKHESKDKDKAGKPTSNGKRAKKDAKTRQSEKQKQGAKQDASAKKKSKKTKKAKTSSPSDKKSNGKKKSSWSSYRANAQGKPDVPLTPHPLYPALGADDESRRAAYRDLFRSALEDAPPTELRMALNQDRPVGNDRFHREIEAVTGQRRELHKRGRPRKCKEDGSEGRESLTKKAPVVIARRGTRHRILPGNQD